MTDTNNDLNNHHNNNNNSNSILNLINSHIGDDNPQNENDNLNDNTGVNNPSDANKETFIPNDNEQDNQQENHNNIDDNVANGDPNDADPYGVEGINDLDNPNVMFLVSDQPEDVPLVKQQNNTVNQNVADINKYELKNVYKQTPYSGFEEFWNQCHYKIRQADNGKKPIKQVMTDLFGDTFGAEGYPIIGNTDAVYCQDMNAWLTTVKTTSQYCLNYQAPPRIVSNCKCLFNANEDHIIEITKYMARKPKKERDGYFKQFINKATEKSTAVISAPNVGSINGCINTFRNLFCLRVTYYARLRDENRRNIIEGTSAEAHMGKDYRKKNSRMKKCKLDVLQFIKDFANKYGEPTATRFVRLSSGVDVRNADVEVLHLPSHLTARGVYTAYVHHNGYQFPKADAKGSYGPISNFRKRKDDPTDAEWPPGQEPTTVCSYSGFIATWKKELPHIYIRPKSADICSDCFVFRNKMKYGKRKRAGTDEDDKEQTDDEDAVTPAAPPNVTPEQYANDDSADGELNGYMNNEQLLEEAGRHVSSARAMRLFVNRRQEESRSLRAAGVSHSNMCYTFVVDYAQNLYVPHCGEEQPGDTYYYSPKNVYMFGVGDVSVVPPHPYAYCYEEENGRKGGNNVASLIMHHLRTANVLFHDDNGNIVKGKRPTIAADNCAGQNKNNMVVRLAAYLVELGYFATVEIVFYIKGHTKNVCDRCFNLLKLQFHRRNVWTFNHDQDEDSLINVIDRNANVHAIPVGPSIFFEWDQYLDQLYKKISNISKNHSFVVEDP